MLLAPQVLAELSHTVGARNPKPKKQFSFANEKWKMEVPHRWELRLAHLELDHPLGFSLNPLWKVWVLLAPQVLAELSHTVGARNPKPKKQFSFANEKWKMEVPHRWELRLAHLELDHPLGFSLNPLWKVWVLLAPQVLAELSHTVGARNPKPKKQFSFANEKWKMEVPHRWELRLAHLELDHPLGFSLNPLWKVWVLLAPQVLAELSHTVGARNPKPKKTVHSSRKSKLQNPKLVDG